MSTAGDCADVAGVSVRSPPLTHTLLSLVLDSLRQTRL